MKEEIEKIVQYIEKTIKAVQEGRKEEAITNLQVLYCYFATRG